MDQLGPVLALAYLGLFGLLSLLGAHRLLMVLLYLRHRKEKPEPAGNFSEPPLVTVQLPLYNEKFVASRLLEAAAALDWPKEKLEIQVLDDSTDETRELVAAKVAELRRRAVPITHVHRDERKGFKAGALAAGLEKAKGEYVAVFDADFLPPPDFLTRTIPFFTDPKVGMVQARWGHLNRSHSLLTAVQAVLLDGHFLLEHTARHRSGRFFNFNGTAGIWRKEAIEDAGGWDQDTLTEDLDLSYRAQLRGWKFVYLPDLVVPGELPAEMNAFKSQQHRWTKGALENSRKLLPRLWKAPVPLKVKLEATVHMTSNLAYLFMLAVSLILLPVLAWRLHHANTWLTWAADGFILFAATISVLLFYALSQAVQGKGRLLRSLLLFPLLMALGIGISLNNALAVLEGLAGKKSPFVRTPKTGGGPGRPGKGAERGYRARIGPLPWIEVLLGLYLLPAVALTASHGLWASAALVALFCGGFLYVGLLSAAPVLARLRPGVR